MKIPRRRRLTWRAWWLPLLAPRRRLQLGGAAANRWPAARCPRHQRFSRPGTVTILSADEVLQKLGPASRRSWPLAKCPSWSKKPSRRGRPALLSAQRRWWASAGLWSPTCRAAGQAGRQHHHPATGSGGVPQPDQTLIRKVKGCSRPEARAPAQQRSDPQPVPQQRLSGLQRLWRG